MTAVTALVRDALGRVGAARRHRDEVAMLRAAPWGDAEAMDRLRLDRLRATVERAATSSPFYRELLQHRAPAIRSWDDLAAVPITSKADFRASGLDRAAPTRLPTRLTWRTSGSSGEPYAYAVDVWNIHRHRAQRAFVYQQAGLEPGERLLEVVPGRGFVAGPDRTYPTFHRTGVGYLRDDVVDAVRDLQPRLLYGNRSHLLQIADQFALDPASSTIDLVCSSSETLHPQDEARLAEVFGAQVLEVYGSAEAANLAFRLPGAAWTILEPRVIVEVLDEHRRPVAPGEVGELVVTTLTERVAPLLRYATGDLARLEAGAGNGSSGVRLAALEGRTVDALVDADGRPVSFWSVAMHGFWASPQVAAHVARWHIHQRADRSVRVAIELTPDGVVDDFEPLLRRHLEPTLGDVPIELAVVDQVRAPGSGKFRAVTSDAGEERS